jgi:hypothetical protein
MPFYSTYAGTDIMNGEGCLLLHSYQEKNDRSRSMMDKPPSPYSDAWRSEQPAQGQESEMIYGYPEQPVQGLEPEIAYSYPYPTGFSQPNYPPYAQGYAGYTGYTDDTPLQQADYANYADAQQPVYLLARKGWNTLWIGLTALALLVLLAGGSLYYYLLTRSTPEKTLHTYCNAIKNEDGHTLYNTYSKDAQTQTDEAHLQQGMRLIEFLSGGIEDCSIDSNSIHENDPQATARVTFTLYNGRLTGTILHLINENGQWKIENNAIFP